MSNHSLKERINQAIYGLESGRDGLELLIEVVDSAGKAIEGISYSMISELRSIESRLVIESGYEKEGVESKPEEAISQLKLWLERVPN